MRACEHWLEGEGRDPSLLGVLTEAAAQSASQLGRDLTSGEIDAICRATIDRLAREAEVRRVKAEREAELEAERLAYLRRRQADLRLTADGPPAGGRS